MGQLQFFAPHAGSVAVVGEHGRWTAQPDPAGYWSLTAPLVDGDWYAVQVDDGPLLLDPSCRDLEIPADGRPRSVWRSAWPSQPRGAALRCPPTVYELHVKGFGGGYLGCIEHLDHVVATGANVIELMPVTPFETVNNYWGYMPLVWGAVHRGYANDPRRAPDELAELIAAAHQRKLHVWLDVVFNHTGEADPGYAIYSLRGLDAADLYRHRPDGRPMDDSGCGNDIDPAHPYVRRLVLEALDRFADLGVDGFRFDLASLLTRDGGGLVDDITQWGRRRQVTLVAEPWDLGSYMVGRAWHWPEWLQWNDHFRDDVRSLLRGEAGTAAAVARRVQGSPDLFGPGGEDRTLNFVTAHDGLTMFDLTSVTGDRHRSWDCGPELRMQQLKNFFAVLMLSRGAAMWVMGDEFGRSQQGNDNPYNVDGPLSWVDWSVAGEWQELTEWVGRLGRVRRRYPIGAVDVFGATGPFAPVDETRSLAWATDRVYVMLNAHWEPQQFSVQKPGEWRVLMASAPHADLVVAPRSVVVLQRVG